LPESDLTAKLALEDLPPGQDIFYRVTLQNHAEPTIFGEPMVGRFRTAPASKRNVRWCARRCAPPQIMRFAMTSPVPPSLLML